MLKGKGASATSKGASATSKVASATSKVASDMSIVGVQKELLPRPRLSDQRTRTAKKPHGKDAAPKLVPRVNLEERVRAILAIESEYGFIKDAKDNALHLVGEMPPTPETIVPNRMDRTNNYFPVFMGRLNPPHKFHLISLITTILIARANGTRALFLLGNGSGPSRSDPLTFGIKSSFIEGKLLEFNFVRSTLDEDEGDYIIDVQGASVRQIHDFISNEYKSEYGDVILFRIGGDKPHQTKTGPVLDVDKIPAPKGFEITSTDGTGITFQTKTVPIKCIKVVIPSQTDPGSEVMSASLVRQTVCESVRANPGNSDLAFRQWQERFTPMYDDEASSRPVFDQIRTFCVSEGGSRRKRKRTRRNLKKLRSKRTIRNRYTRYKRRI
jgi:hypothetical protein